MPKSRPRNFHFCLRSQYRLNSDFRLKAFLLLMMITLGLFGVTQDAPISLKSQSETARLSKNKHQIKTTFFDSAIKWNVNQFEIVITVNDTTSSKVQYNS